MFASPYMGRKRVFPMLSLHPQGFFGEELKSAGGCLWFPPEGRVPHIPDFLGSLAGSASFMRLSLKKGAYAVMSRAAYRKFGASRSFFARCGIPLMLTLSVSDDSRVSGIRRLSSSDWCSGKQGFTVVLGGKPGTSPTFQPAGPPAVPAGIRLEIHWESRFAAPSW